MNIPLHILIVDDNALDRQASRRALLASDLETEVSETNRAAEALARLTSEPFDGVLLDFQLPDANGLEILHDAQALGIDVPIIMLTGHGDELLAVELIKAGAADYLPKAKLTPEALARTLRNAIRVRRAESEAAQAEAERGRLMENLAAEQGQMEAVLTSMTDGLVASDLAGRVVAMNPAALTMLGFHAMEDVPRPLREFAGLFVLTTPDGRDLEPEEWPLIRALQGETFSNFEANLRRRDTGLTLTASIGGTQARGRTGEALLAIITLHDITEIKKAQWRAAFLAEAGTILASSLEAQVTLKNVVQLAASKLVDWCAVNVRDSSGTVHLLADARSDQSAPGLEMQRLYSLDPGAALGVGHVLQTGQSQLIADVSEDAARAAEQDGVLDRLRSLGLCSYLCVPLWARGHVLGTLSFASLQSGRIYSEEDLKLAEELAQRVSVALDNAHLFEEAQKRAEREALINKIGQALRVTLDTDEILQIVTEQVGQALKVSRCSWARLLPARGVLEVAPQQYTAPGVLPLTFSYRLDDCPQEAVETWTSGRSVVSHDYTQDPASVEAGIHDLTRAFIACPVFLRGLFSGLFIVHQNGAPRAWTPEEVSFLSAVTDILALALENSRLYAREHRVADMLQSAFLTDIPDLLPGLALGANYSAGLDESHVGGDYYDAFRLPDGRAALVIADVSGKGLKAAVQTATVKYSLRAFATEAAAPALVLTRLNTLLCSDSSGLGDHFVTLFYAVFDPATGRLLWASAGHETMLLKRAAGGSVFLEASGPILGIGDHNYEQMVDYLAPEDSLVLYTDGLTEARAAGSREMLELDRVCELVEAVPAEAGAGALAARLREAAMKWTEGRPQDDMALLVARRLPVAETAKAAAEAADARFFPETLSFNDGDIKSEYRKNEAWNEEKNSVLQEDKQEDREKLFAFRFRSRAEYAAEVRQAIGYWMRTVGFDREATEDFQTAVTEAVTNAVRHGSPKGEVDEFRVTGWRTAEGALRVEVADNGPGVSPLLRPTMPEPEALGGRGLPLMQELADLVEFHFSAVGYRVVLLKHGPEHVPE